MQKRVKKPKWSKPELIVLVRGRPEEKVLDVCKYLDGSLGAGFDQNMCRGQPHGCHWCSTPIET